MLNIVSFIKIIIDDEWMVSRDFIRIEMLDLFILKLNRRIFNIKEIYLEGILNIYIDVFISFFYIEFLRN